MIQSNIEAFHSNAAQDQSGAAASSSKLLEASGAYEQCKPGALLKAVTYADDMLTEGAFDAYIGARLGSKFGKNGVLAGAIAGAGAGITRGYFKAQNELKGQEQSCIEDIQAQPG